MIERIAEAVSTPSRSPRQYMPPFTGAHKRDDPARGRNRAFWAGAAN
jgi:hypothetical protein